MSRFGHYESSRPRLVFDALRILDMATAELLSVYTGLTLRAVIGVLREDRYDWCELVDYEVHRGYSPKGNCYTWQRGIWQYTGPETLT